MVSCGFKKEQNRGSGHFKRGRSPPLRRRSLCGWYLRTLYAFGHDPLSTCVAAAQHFRDQSSALRGLFSEQIVASGFYSLFHPRPFLAWFLSHLPPLQSFYPLWFPPAYASSLPQSPPCTPRFPDYLPPMDLLIVPGLHRCFQTRMSHGRGGGEMRLGEGTSVSPDLLEASWE